MLEAMACGLPVIATDVGVSDVVTDQVDGRLFAPRDVRGAAGAIHSLATDRSGTLGLGRAARDRVVAKFNIVDQVDRSTLLVNFSRSIR